MNMIDKVKREAKIPHIVMDLAQQTRIHILHVKAFRFNPHKRLERISAGKPGKPLSV